MRIGSATRPIDRIAGGVRAIWLGVAIALAAAGGGGRAFASPAEAIEGRWSDWHGAEMQLSKEGDEIVARLIQPGRREHFGFVKGDVVFRGRLTPEGLKGRYLTFKKANPHPDFGFFRGDPPVPYFPCPELNLRWVDVTLAAPWGSSGAPMLALSGSFVFYWDANQPGKCEPSPPDAKGQISWFKLGVPGVAAVPAPGASAGGAPPATAPRLPERESPERPRPPTPAFSATEAGCQCRLLNHRFLPWQGISAQLILPEMSGVRHRFPIDRAEIPLKASGQDTDLLELITVEQLADGRERCRGSHFVSNRETVVFRWSIKGDGSFHNDRTSADGEAVIYRAPVLAPGEEKTVEIEVEANDPITGTKGDDPPVRARVSLRLRRPAAESERRFTTIEIERIGPFPKPAALAMPQGTPCGCSVQALQWLAGSPLTVSLQKLPPVCPNGLDVLAARAEDFDDLSITVGSASCGGETQTILQIPDIVEYKDWRLEKGQLVGGSEGREVVYRASRQGGSDGVLLAEADDVAGNQADDQPAHAKGEIGVRPPLRTAIVLDGGNAGASSDLGMWQLGVRNARAMTDWLEKSDFRVVRLSTDPKKAEKNVAGRRSYISYADEPVKKGLFMRTLQEVSAPYLKSADPGRGCCDELFLYLNGHGDAGGVEVNVVGKGDDDIPFSQILALLETLPKWVKVTVFIDACGSGGFFTGTSKTKASGETKLASNMQRVMKFCNGHCGLTVLTAVDEFCYAQSLASPLPQWNIIDSFTADFFNEGGGIRQKFLRARRDGERYTKSIAAEHATLWAGATPSPPQCFRCPADGPWCSLDTDPAGGETLCTFYTPSRAPAPVPEDRDCQRGYEEKKHILDEEKQNELDAIASSYDPRTTEARLRIEGLEGQRVALEREVREKQAAVSREKDPDLSRCDALAREMENKLSQLDGASAGTRQALWESIRALENRWKECLARSKQLGPELAAARARSQTLKDQMRREQDGLAALVRQRSDALAALDRQFGPRYAELRQELERCLQSRAPVAPKRVRR